MSSELTIKEDQTVFTPHQRAALTQIGVQEASEADLAVFLHQVKRTGLDPFARQIYMIGRRQKQGNQWVMKQTIQTGIDGFRLIARRAVDKAQEVLSISQPFFATEDGKWLDFWPFPHPPVAAKVMVKRGDGEFPAVAMFREYAGTTRDGSLTRMWADKPSVMIGKCAEALALRKAFPLDLSGLYTAEEMDAAANEAAPRVVTPVVTAEKVAVETDPDRLRDWWRAANKAGDDALKTLIVGRVEELKTTKPDPEPEPVGEVIEDAEIVEDKATAQQLTALNAGIMALLGETDRAERLAWLSNSLEREITTSADVTKQEASWLIGWMNSNGGDQS